MDDVIDFRFRPVGARSVTRDQTFNYLAKMRLDPCPSFLEESPELMLAEMDAAGKAFGENAKRKFGGQGEW